MDVSVNSAMPILVWGLFAVILGVVMMWFVVRPRFFGP